ncbi:histidine kinase [Winogradskyella sp. E313]|uniref:histidine kinase n=2 Tax=Winogradskyella immobilis TaxID=2816852 RepID=A0ABS8EKQ9_9FLAO|nr:histidine kinase [Winogradskyella immobilis]
MLFVILAISSLIIIFFVVFQKRKNKLLLDNIEQQRQFDEELLKTQQEIQDETLKHVGRELHDNVGQLMTVATMQMNAVVRKVDDALKPKAEEAAAVLKESLTEVRALSKSLNSDVIYNLGFDKTVINEVERLNRAGRLEAYLNIEGEKINFENKKDEIILFRIMQEFFSNTIKYAEAEHIHININYTLKGLSISIKDDGNGFDVNTVEKGSGLINMQKRAELINTTFNLKSELGKGTELQLSYPFVAN